MKDHAENLFSKVKESFHVEDIAKRNDEMLAKIPIEYAPGADLDQLQPAGIDAYQTQPEKR